MARMSLFNSPLLLGFDEFERTLDRITKGGESYPPYNVEQVDDTHLRITLALAGFQIENLSIEVTDNQLSVRGQQSEDEKKIYLHRGIATRQFHKNFVLAEGIEVTSASLENGLLLIELQRIKTRPKVQSIPIAKKTKTASEGAVAIEEGK